MTLEEYVEAFGRDMVRELLEPKFAQVSKDYMFYQQVLETQRRLGKDILLEELRIRSIPRPLWDIYWLFVWHLADPWLEKWLAGLRVELENMMYALHYVKDDRGKDLDVDVARQFPLKHLFRGDLQRSGKTLRGNCPFHDDRSPSFYIYPETNSFFCFGCGKWGSPIDFVMLSRGLDFASAVRFLL